MNTVKGMYAEAKIFTDDAETYAEPQKEKQAFAAWREHKRIVRGNPVRIYEGEKFVLKKS